jgi:hypothetical protein
MELLQDMDKYRLFDLFTENYDEKKDSIMPEPKEEKQKKK